MSTAAWRPGATHAALRRRAGLLQVAREFFHARNVLEVETPVVVSRTVTDPQIESIALDDGQRQRYLHTSPEYAMKRLLASGSGDIFQICRVFRAGERSRLHNPEFTMIEWYRQGFTLPAIMSETATLAMTLFSAGGRSSGDAVEYLSYQSAFRATLGVDPLSADHGDLRDLCLQHGLAAQSIVGSTRDDLLDFLVATCVGPKLGHERLVCLHGFPASQAALAQLDPMDSRVAQRFELYARGVELANGYLELADPAEQRRRFAADLAERRRRGRSEPEVDESLLAALESGMPACAGVALGFDRTAMLALSATSIDEVLAFPWEKA